MARNPTSMQSRRRSRRRYATLVVLVLALAAGWIGFWQYAAGEVRLMLDGWRAREAKAGRVYDCGAQSVGGFPFRFELDCERASALFRGTALPLQIETRRVLVVAQVYQPTLLIGEYTGPLTIAEQGQSPSIVVDWKLAQIQPARHAGGARARGAGARRAGDRAAGRQRAAGFAARPACRDARPHRRRLRRRQAGDRAGAARSTRARCRRCTAWRWRRSTPTSSSSLRGLNDFSPKPWPMRFREIQAAGGRIDITQARLAQGETLAVGSGSLTLNADGKLQGELRMTIAGIEPFLAAIGARQMVQKSAPMDKLAGMLDRLSPGLGDAARQQAGANIALGLNLIGRPATLEGKRALILPLRFEDGEMFLGPIRIGSTPALF